MVSELFMQREHGELEVGQLNSASVIRRSAESPPKESGHYLRDILSTKKESEDSASSSDEEQQQQVLGLELTVRPAELAHKPASPTKTESTEESVTDQEILGNKHTSPTLPQQLLGCKKRKLYQPQQHESSRQRDEEEPDAKYQRQEAIEALQQEYARIYSQALAGVSEKEGESQLDLSLKEKQRPEQPQIAAPFSAGLNAMYLDATRRMYFEQEKMKEHKETAPAIPQPELDGLADLLKNELQTSLAAVIDQVVQRYIQQRRAAQQKLAEEAEAKSRSRVVDRGLRQEAPANFLRAPMNMPFFPHHKLPLYPGVNPLNSLSSLSAMTTLAGLSNQHEQKEQEQNEALSLVVSSKKRRNKVTDGRGIGRGCDTPNMQPTSTSSPHPYNISSRYSPTMSPKSEPSSPPRYNTHIPSNMVNSLPSGIPTSVPGLDAFSPYAAYYRRAVSPDNHDSRIPQSSLMHPALFAAHHPDFSALRHADIDRNSESSGETYDSLHPSLSLLSNSHASTLTPMHLRKAKLMFFWVRYPSSSVLKMYFPDIRFNKNNTAQLVKWFSNFREFYYIQMEKYARQLLSDGVQNVDDVRVSADSELFRILNLHYNRNNHIEVPSPFLYVVEQTLKEFFRALQAGKDLEPSWKKAIYKVIARLDDNVPDYFKSPNFLEHLE